uniref:Retrotransposon protein, putative, Ty3-gypsy subclass n=1 Tax=Oryza sativa subsp. japonica TaxID=39947 RepID=Q2QQ31_ORYSJ|nr:retrotransposon protein, putative, Ty3-gypsy subclass [Oryza sativa Japonica Group]
MSYYVDRRTSVPQYPLYPVYGYPPSIVVRQVEGLGAQGSTTMTSSFVDNSVNTNLNQGVPTSTMLVWTQIGEIVFPVYTTVPILAGPSMAGNENTVATTQGDSMSKDPPAEAEIGTSTTSEPEKDPSAAKPCLSDKNHESTRMTSEHIRAVNAILRETPYDPVLNDDLARWTERLRESVTNLSNAFEEAAAAVHPEQPPTGDANGENPEQRESPHRATPPPRGTGDLRDHLNGRREAQRTRDNENRSRHRVSSRRHDNEERGGRSSEDRDRGHNRHDHDDRERRVLGDTDRHPRRTYDRRQPTAPSAGCRAFGCSLRDVRWPERFRPGEIQKYDGNTDPEEFLQVYSTVLYAAGADNNALANYLPTALKDLWQQFVANFQGTYKRHAIEDDLHAFNEFLRDYVRHFNECRNTIPKIIDASVIRAFKSGVRDRYTTQELATRRITTTRRLFEIVDRCAHVDDALRRKNNKPKTGGEKKPVKDAPESSKKKNRKSGKRKAQADVLATEYADPPKHPYP